MGHVPPKITSKDLEDFSTVLELRENPVYAAQIMLNRDYDAEQAFAIWGMWTHPFSMLDWGRGVGKCVAGDTLILLSDGTEVTIEELYNRQKRFISYESNEWWAVLEENLDVKSYDPSLEDISDRRVQTILRQRVKEALIKITFVNGKTITCTRIHKFLNSDLEWVEAKMLKKGMKVIGFGLDSDFCFRVIKDIQIVSGKDAEYVYDLSVPETKNYVANGLITHNTTMASDVEILSALLYPGTTSLVVSHSMKGAKLVFDELIKTWMRADIVQESASKRPTKGNDICEMPFNSINPSTGQQTIIKGIASDINNDGASIRGNRVSRCLHVDEWIFIPQDLINGAVMPCASTTDDPTRPEYDLGLTRFIFTCSSGYTYMEAYKRMEAFRKFCYYPEKYPDDAYDKFGRPQYFYHNLNYTKVTKPGILNEKNIRMWKATFPAAKFNTEVMAVWESQSGSWYNAKDIKGDPEDTTGKSRGIWVSSKNEDPNAQYKEMDKEEGSDIYVLGIDPAEQKDETGLVLIRVTPDKLYIADTQGFEDTSMPDVAEIIRDYVDKYNIVSIAMDPEGGGRAGVTPDLKTVKMRQDQATGKNQVFMPIYPVRKFLKKDEEVPPGARQILKYYTFSANANEANLTDLNSTLRTLMKTRGLLVANDGPEDFQERVDILMQQIIAIEATPISATKGIKENGNQAANKDRYSFSSRIRKDRWAALIIGVWEALIIQAEMNIEVEEEDPGVIVLPNIYDGSFGFFGGF